MMNMSYEHRQTGFLHVIILVPVLAGMTVLFMANPGLWPSVILLLTMTF